MKIDAQAAAGRAHLARELGIEECPCPENREEWSKCKRDCKYWVETYVKTYDPRRSDGDRWVSFILWDRQKEYLDWLAEQRKADKHCVVCKCRTVGASWLTLCFFLHVWLFERDSKLTLGSRKEDLVDNQGDPDSLFEKVRRTLEGLPEWMRPPGFQKNKHDLKLKLMNPWSNSVMTGEGGENMGTGGRSTMYLIDEFAKVDFSQKVQAAVQDNSRFIVYVSTPEGTANEFARMIEEGEHPVFYFSVYDDPTRNHWELWENGELVKTGNGKDSPPKAVYPWIEKERKLRNPVNFAQEVMGDLYASMQDSVCPSEWVRAAVNFPVKCTGPVIAGLDLGGGERLSTVLTPRQGPKTLGQVCTGGRSATKKLTDLLMEVDQARTPEGHKITQVTYDASGETGSSFGKELQGKRFSFTLIPLVGQATASKRMWPDGLRSDQKFANLRTEAYFVFRERLRKTYENTQGMTHPEDECCSIPNDPELFQQLSKIQYETTETGKIRVVSKAKMRSEGMKSPDKADSLVYAYMYEKMEVSVHDRFKKAG